MAQFFNQGVPGGHMCGGATDHYDSTAPQEIQSTEVVYFSISTSLTTLVGQGRYSQFYAYASKLECGNLIVLNAYRTRGEADSFCTVITDDIFPQLDAIVRKYNLASRNGSHHSVSGLPQNFGGSIDIKYASGEFIDKSNNQSPMFSGDCADETADLFLSYYEKGTRPEAPCGADIEACRYAEERSDGGYKRLTLAVNEESGKWHISSREYFAPFKIKSKDSASGETLISNPVYEKDRDLDAEDPMAQFREAFDASCMFAWPYLPKRSGKMYDDYAKSVTFIMKDGSEIKAEERHKIPYAAKGGSIFAMEQYLDSLLKEEKQ